MLVPLGQKQRKQEWYDSCYSPHPVACILQHGDSASRRYALDIVYRVDVSPSESGSERVTDSPIGWARLDLPTQVTVVSSRGLVWPMLKAIPDPFPVSGYRFVTRLAQCACRQT